MYCVIQEIQRKKPNPYGHERELEACSYETNGKRRYYYRHTGGRFERPILTAYKVSIHESRRVDGVVTKRQFVVTTVDYYALVDYSIEDCVHSSRIDAIAASLSTTPAHLWELIHAKVDPLEARIGAEFAETPEGKTKARHGEILATYCLKKQAFAERWGVDADTYDCCYDVFGNVVNQLYLDEIIKAARQRERSYQEAGNGNYSGYDYSRLLGAATSKYSAEDKTHLKKFYRALSKLYHPDVNREIDTHAEMVLLNQLKEDWGI